MYWQRPLLRSLPVHHTHSINKLASISQRSPSLEVEQALHLLQVDNLHALKMQTSTFLSTALFLTLASALPLNINFGAYSPALVVGDGAIEFEGGEAVEGIALKSAPNAQVHPSYQRHNITPIRLTSNPPSIANPTPATKQTHRHPSPPPTTNPLPPPSFTPNPSPNPPRHPPQR